MLKARLRTEVRYQGCICLPSPPDPEAICDGSATAGILRSSCIWSGIQLSTVQLLSTTALPTRTAVRRE